MAKKPGSVFILALTLITQSLFGCAASDQNADADSAIAAQDNSCGCASALPDDAYPSQAIPGFIGAANQTSYQAAVRRAAAVARDRIWQAETIDAQSVEAALLAMHCQYKTEHRNKFFQFSHLIQFPWEYEVREIIRGAGLEPPGQNARPFGEADTNAGNFLGAKSNFAKPSSLVSTKHILFDSELLAAGFDSSYLPLLVSKDRSGRISFHIGLHKDVWPYAIEWLAAQIQNLKQLIEQLEHTDNPDLVVDQAQQILARMSYLLANAGFFHSGNWGTYYILIAQAREHIAERIPEALIDKSGLHPRTSSGLDYFMIHADDISQAQSIYRAWGLGALDPGFYSSLGGNIRVKYRAPGT